jgi:hypothetical protein
MRTHDGVQAPLPPSIPSALMGVVVLGGGVAAGMFFSWCVGAPLIPIGALMVLNQARGKHRVRLTFSKLLVEDERLVWGFLVGPAKRRIAWEDYAGAEVQGHELVVKDKQGGELRIGQGCPTPELEELKGRVEESATRFREEGGGA